MSFQQLIIKYITINPNFLTTIFPLSLTPNFRKSIIALPPISPLLTSATISSNCLTAIDSPHSLFPYLTDFSLSIFPIPVATLPPYHPSIIRPIFIIHSVDQPFINTSTPYSLSIVLTSRAISSKFNRWKFWCKNLLLVHLIK